jgi:hypothetical protein
MIFLYSTEHVPRVQLYNIYIFDHYICFAEVVSLIRALLTFTHLASAKYRQQDERKKNSHAL